MRRLLLVVALLVPPMLSAQSTRPPVIDVHLHAPLSPGPVDSFTALFASYLSEMDSLNVRVAVLNGRARAIKGAVLDSMGEHQVHSRTPVLLKFLVTLPSTMATGRWRERGRMGRR